MSIGVVNACSLKTDVGSLSSVKDVEVLVVVVLTACAAKFIGCSMGAKLSGLNWRESATIGILVSDDAIHLLLFMMMKLCLFISLTTRWLVIDEYPWSSRAYCAEHWP